MKRYRRMYADIGIFWYDADIGVSRYRRLPDIGKRRYRETPISVYSDMMPISAYADHQQTGNYLAYLGM
jgi:hypothetical protein